MKKRRSVIAIGVLGVVSLLTGVALNPLLNLISSDLAYWYSENRTLALILTGTLVAVGLILTFASVWLSFRREESMIQENRGSGPNTVTVQDALTAVYEAYKASPGEKTSLKTIHRQLGLPEQEFIDLIAELEGREFVEATWIGREALLTITEDGILMGRSLAGE
jgi:hypothetical protein